MQQAVVLHSCRIRSQLPTAEMDWVLGPVSHGDAPETLVRGSLTKASRW